MKADRYRQRDATPIGLAADAIVDEAECLALDVVGRMATPVAEIPDDELGRLRATCLTTVVAQRAREVAGLVLNGRQLAPSVTEGQLRGAVLGVIVATRTPDLARWFR